MSDKKSDPSTHVQKVEPKKPPPKDNARDKPEHKTSEAAKEASRSDDTVV